MTVLLPASALPVSIEQQKGTAPMTPSRKRLSRLASAGLHYMLSNGDFEPPLTAAERNGVQRALAESFWKVAQVRAAVGADE